MALVQTGLTQTPPWMEIIRHTTVEAKYYFPAASTSWKPIALTDSRENDLSLIRQFSDESMNVALTFRKLGSHIEMSGEVENRTGKELSCTIRIVEPLSGIQDVTWGHDLDSVLVVHPGDRAVGNFVDAKTVIPPAGAFNTDSTHNGGYGDNVGTGQMSFFPVAHIATGDRGLVWGVDMGIPLVFRLAYDPAAGMTAEFDLSVSPETKQFPNRAFFKLLFFETDPLWHLRSALAAYYRIQPEFFKKRVTQEGIWLPFAPLCEIKGWQDFGFAYHETNFNSRDRAFTPPLSSIEAGKRAHVLTFEYTEPWEEEIPIQKLNLTYEEAVGTATSSDTHAAYMRSSAGMDKAGKLIARKLETPWFPSGWAVSINTNTDPDLKGVSRYDFEREHEINPALKMNVDGIYFDCLEWHWQYDLNYNRSHFASTDYPLTFSSSVQPTRPVIWCYASNYEFIKRIADEMHSQGKLVMGNSFTWIPFAAGVLDIFGSELSLYVQADTKMSRLQFARAMADQKPVVFLLNEGLDDTVFTRPPYRGYQIYFDRLAFYGFFPSFFSVNATSNNYWADTAKYEKGRPFFKTYIPIIRQMSRAGWQPVTYAKLSNKGLLIERFGAAEDSSLYFSVYNPHAGDQQTVVMLDAVRLGLPDIAGIDELISGRALSFKRAGATFEVPLSLKGLSTQVISVRKPER
jgi:hypothetical protein